MVKESFDKVFAREHDSKGAGKTFTHEGRSFSTNRADGRDLRAERLSRAEPVRAERPARAERSDTGRLRGTAVLAECITQLTSWGPGALVGVHLVKAWCSAACL
jgi:hypothetical protein